MLRVAPLPEGNAVERLAAAVDDVLADRSPQPAARLSEELVAMRLQIDRLEGAFSDRLSRFAQLRGHVAEGAVSIVAWLRYRCRLASRDAVMHASVARSLTSISGACELLRSGDIAFGHATVIAQAVDDRGAAVMSKEGPTMLEAAQQMDCDRFAVVVRHLRHALDRDGEHDDERRRHLARYLRLGDRDGMCVLEGQMDSESGAVLRAALETLSRPLPGDERSAPVRRVDALGELARRHLSGAEAPAGGGLRPHIIVTTTLPTLAGVRGAPAGQLSGGTTLPSETVRRLACDAAITRLDCEAAEDVHHASEERRTIPPRLRRALIARDGGCRFPSCDRPPEWTDAHHIIHWVDGGKTRLNNLVLLCRTHHRYVHEDGWSISLTRESGVVVRPP